VSVKNISIGVVIGAVWQGAKAVADSSVAVSKLAHSIEALKAKKATLKVDTKEYEQAEKKIKALGDAIQKINERKVKIDTIVANQDKFKSQIGEKIALGASVVAPLKVAIDFESSMADVKKVVNFVNELDFKQFESSLLSLSRTIPLSATELASIAASGGQLGIAKDKLLDFTQVVAKMSTAFDMSAESAGDSIAKLMNVYGLNIKEATSLGDAINHLSDNSAAKARDMVEALGRIGGTAKVFGLSATQASALANGFIALGKPPEVAATGINALLSKLATADKQGGKFQKALKAIGLDAKSLKSSIEEDANGALVDFLKRLSEVDKRDQMGILTDLFGAEYSDDIALLVGSINVYEDALKNIGNAQNYTGSMQKEFENRSKTTANNLQLLKSSLTEIAINIGSVLLPALNAIIEPVRAVFNGIASLMSANPIFGSIIKAVAGLTLGVIGLSVAISAISFVGGYFMIGLLKLKNALTIVGVGVRFLGMAIAANPIGAAIAGIAIAATLIYTYWEPIKGFFGSLWSGIKSIFSSAWESLKSILSFSPMGLILGVWEPVFSWFRSKFEWLGAAVSKVMDVGSKIAGFFGFGNSDKSDKSSNPAAKTSSNVLHNVGSNIAGFFGFGSEAKPALAAKVGAVALATTAAVATPALKQPTISPTVQQPVISPALKQLTISPTVQQPVISPVTTQKIPTISQAKQIKNETNISININNPKVTTQQEKDALKSDILKVVEEALRKKEQASKNKSLKDVA